MDDAGGEIAEEGGVVAVSRGTFFRECEVCGARLDPGETCDCKKEADEAETASTRQSKPERVGAAVAS